MCGAAVKGICTNLDWEREGCACSWCAAKSSTMHEAASHVSGHKPCQDQRTWHTHLHQRRLALVDRRQHHHCLSTSGQKRGRLADLAIGNCINGSSSCCLVHGTTEDATKDQHQVIRAAHKHVQPPGALQAQGDCQLVAAQVLSNLLVHAGGGCRMAKAWAWA